MKLNKNFQIILGDGENKLTYVFGDPERIYPEEISKKLLKSIKRRRKDIGGFDEENGVIFYKSPSKSAIEITDLIEKDLTLESNTGIYILKPATKEELRNYGNRYIRITSSRLSVRIDCAQKDSGIYIKEPDESSHYHIFVENFQEV